MFNRTRVFYALGVLLLGLSGLGMLALTPPRPAEAHEDSLYAHVQATAAGGAAEARLQLARLNAHLTQLGLPIPPQEAGVGEIIDVNGATVRVKGHAPFYVKLYNQTPLTSPAAIDQYIAARSDALHRLAAADPDRAIEVSISPDDDLDIPTFWRLKEAHGLNVDAMAITVLVNGQRHSHMGLADPDEPGESSTIDFSQPAPAVEARIRALIPHGVLAQEGIQPEQLVVKVSWVRGTMRAADAVLLNADTDILLVDPISDIRDAYMGPALDVKVVDVPHLLRWTQPREDALAAP